MYNKAQKDQQDYINGIPTMREFYEAQFFDQRLEKYRLNKKRKKLIMQDFNDYLELFTESYKKDQFEQLKSKIAELERQLKETQERSANYQTKYQSLKKFKGRLTSFEFNLKNLRRK